MKFLRNTRRGASELQWEGIGGVVTAAIVVAILMVPGEGLAEALKDWPEKETISPKSDTPVRDPSKQPVVISYRCGPGGDPCNLRDFMDRNLVCDILVIRGSKLHSHVKFSDKDDDSSEKNVHSSEKDADSTKKNDHVCMPKKESDKNGTLAPIAEDDKTRRHGVASITKSFTSILFGWVNSDPIFGSPISLDTKAKDALKASVDYLDEQATVRDLLQMSSGMTYNPHRDMLTVRVEEGTAGCKADPKGPDCTLRGKARTFLKDAHFESRTTQPDGSLEQPDYFYSDFDSTLLGIIVEDRFRAAERGKGPESPRLAYGLKHFLWEALPVADDAWWKADYQHHSPGYCCLKVTPHDMATLGHWVKDLYRGEPSEIVGTWAKKVGAENVLRMRNWLRESVSDRRERIDSCQFGTYKRDIDYGYQWWIPTPEIAGDPPGGDGFTGIGIRGQYLHVFPEQDVVVVQLSSWPVPRRWFEFWRWLERSEGNRTCESLMVHRLIADKVASMEPIRN